MKYSHNLWGHNVLLTISRSKGQRSRSNGSFEAPWLPPYLTESMCGIRTTHEGAMCRSPFLGQNVKGQGNMSRFKFLSCPLCGFVPIWLNYFICGVHTTHEGTICRAPFSEWKVKGQGHMGSSKFLPCSLRGLLLIWPKHFICGIHKTNEDAMCCAQCFVICPLGGPMPIRLTFGSWGVRSY